MADEEILLKIKVDNDAANKSLTEQTRKVDLLKEANSKLLKENKELAKQGSVTAKQRSENSKQIALNRAKIAESNATIKENIKALKTQSNSYGAMKVRLKEVTQAIDKVDLSTEAGEAQIKKLREEQNKLTTALKNGEAQGGSFSRNVGNYTNSIKGLEEAINGLRTKQNELDITTEKGKEEYKQINQQINVYNTQINKTKNSTKSFTSNIKNAAAESGAFGGALDAVGQVIKLNPIGLLVSGLVALVAAFSKTEKGAKFFAVAGEVVNQLFNELVGLLGSVGTSVVSIFEDPVESLKTFANLFKNYIVDKFNAYIDGLGLAATAIKKLFKGDFEGALESAGNSVLKFAEANPLVDLFKEGAEVIADTTKKIVENTSKTIDNASARFDLERSIGKQQVAISKLLQEEEKLNKEFSTLPKP